MNDRTFYKMRFLLLICLSLILASQSLWASESKETKSCSQTSAAQNIDQYIFKTTARLDELLAVTRVQTPQDFLAIYKEVLPLLSKTDGALLFASENNLGKKYSDIDVRLRKLDEQIGHFLGQFGDIYGSIIHGSKAWAPYFQTIDNPRDQGPKKITVYYDSFRTRKAPQLTLEERESEYNNRTVKFKGRGGRFEDIISWKPGTEMILENYERYDFVLDLDGSMRLYNSDTKRFPKMGHSLIAVASEKFEHKQRLLAGEFWVLRNTHRQVVAIYVSNTSGHFLPRYRDIGNFLLQIEKLQLPKDKIVFLGGPNDHEEISIDYATNFNNQELKQMSWPSPFEQKQLWSDCQNF